MKSLSADYISGKHRDLQRLTAPYSNYLELTKDSAVGENQDEDDAMAT